MRLTIIALAVLATACGGSDDGDGDGTGGRDAGGAAGASGAGGRDCSQIVGSDCQTMCPECCRQKGADDGACVAGNIGPLSCGCVSAPGN